MGNETNMVCMIGSSIDGWCVSKSVVPGPGHMQASDFGETAGWLCLMRKSIRVRQTQFWVRVTAGWTYCTVQSEYAVSRRMETHVHMFTFVFKGEGKGGGIKGIVCLYTRTVCGVDIPNRD